MLADLVFPTSVAMLLVGELANSLLYLFGTMMIAPFSLDLDLRQYEDQLRSCLNQTN